MSPTIYRKYKYFHSAVQTAEDGRQKFYFCRLPSDVTSCLISLIAFLAAINHNENDNKRTLKSGN